MSAMLKPAPPLERQKYLGSGDAAAILGISPWRTPLDVYLDKVEPRVEQLTPERARVLRRGQRMEPYVIDVLSEETGLEIVARGNRYLDPEHPFIASEIDAEACARGSSEIVNVEIKTVSPFKAREWGEEQTDEIPLHYTAQVMHALMVTGRERCVMGVLIGGDDFRLYHVQRDDEAIMMIREREVSFWQQVQRREAPPPTTVADIARLYGKSIGLAREADDATAEAFERLVEVRKALKPLEAEKDELESRIKLFLAEADALAIKGRPVLTWKSQDARRFDQSAFKAAHPELFEQFVKVQSSRVLRIK